MSVCTLADAPYRSRRCAVVAFLLPIDSYISPCMIRQARVPVWREVDVVLGWHVYVLNAAGRYCVFAVVWQSCKGIARLSVRCACSTLDSLDHELAEGRTGTLHSFRPFLSSAAAVYTAQSQLPAELSSAFGLTTNSSRWPACLLASVTSHLLRCYRQNATSLS